MKKLKLLFVLLLIVACDEQSDDVTTCATTANCGCSGKTKSACESDACCQWIVGTGCKCN
ncbi:hypothetical protein [uncultured Aquimarina sp.]|uniref:hypothetical protein n=1 Tax=uncultured Aquimarina sp. TaxID=575652 RepID=UPI0026040504|nr:hypothetical protein [uncultured Aquimarina sp.]